VSPSRLPEGSGTTEQVLHLPDAAALADLAAYLGRAKAVDPDGAVRLVGLGVVLAAYVSPLHGGGGPTVLGLRTTALAAPAQVDVTVSLASMNDRFARLGGLPGTATPRAAAGPDASGGGPVDLPVPPTSVPDAAWAGVAPPRRGWEPVGLVPIHALDEVARDGVAQIVEGAPQGSGAAAVAQLRGRVWGRHLSPETGDAPAGLAFAAKALGFLREGEPAALYRSGPWTRLTTSAGHVLARGPALLP
jgi:hypothetical protein